MSESEDSPARPTDPVGRVLFSIARAFALGGGLVLCAMALMTTISVIGRAAFNSPVFGDFELVAVGTGVAVFALLPYCQLVRANVIVDFFMDKAPFRVKSFFDAIGSLTYGLIMVLVTWRTSLGTLDMFETGETTQILALPRWWTFPPAVICLALLCVVCAYTLRRSIRETRLGRTI